MLWTKKLKSLKLKPTGSISKIKKIKKGDKYGKIVKLKSESKSKTKSDIRNIKIRSQRKYDIVKRKRERKIIIIKIRERTDKSSKSRNIKTVNRLFSCFGKRTITYCTTLICLKKMKLKNLKNKKRIKRKKLELNQTNQLNVKSIKINRMKTKKISKILSKISPTKIGTKKWNLNKYCNSTRNVTIENKNKRKMIKNCEVYGMVVKSKKNKSESKKYIKPDMRNKKSRSYDKSVRTKRKRERKVNIKTENEIKKKSEKIHQKP